LIVALTGLAAVGSVLLVLGVRAGMVVAFIGFVPFIPIGLIGAEGVRRIADGLRFRAWVAADPPATTTQK
ncbi:MAG: hypothetical protein AAGA56_05725, partial [Myxococcota bacterium]